MFSQWEKPWSSYHKRKNGSWCSTVPLWPYSDHQFFMSWEQRGWRWGMGGREKGKGDSSDSENIYSTWQYIWHHLRFLNFPKTAKSTKIVSKVMKTTQRMLKWSNRCKQINVPNRFQITFRKSHMHAKNSGSFAFNIKTVINGLSPCGSIPPTPPLERLNKAEEKT